MVNPVDIRPDHLEIVQGILREHLPVGVKVWVFGSRANWTTKDSSDLDLALECDNRLSHKVLGPLKDAFEDSSLPYTVDVVDMSRIADSFRQIVESQRTPLPIDRVLTDGATLAVAAGQWRDVTLGDLIDIRHGFAFKGNFIYDEPRGDLLLTPGNFAIGGGFKRDKFKYYDGPVEEGYVLQEGDLLVTMTDLSKQSDTLGYPAMVPAYTNGRRYLHNQRLGKVVSKETSELHTGFLYYLMRSAKYRHEVLASATGTTVKHTSPDKIRQFRFSLPPLAEQRAIAHILGTLDDKIELNRRMNETLEEMARALFKSWFVDFDPVRAKMEGRWHPGESLPGLPAHLYDLFPARLVDSELGDIPEGWEVGVLDDTVELLSGGTPKTSEATYWDGTIPWFTAKDTPSPIDIYVLKTERCITEAGVESSSTKILPAGTTVITARGTVGKLACLGVPMAMNQTCYGIRGAAGYPDYFTYWSVRTAVHELQTRTHGTIFDTITRQTFSLVQMPLAPLDLACQFELVVGPAMLRILKDLQEAHSLASQRDMLLPRLVSGLTKIPRNLTVAMVPPQKFHIYRTE